MKKLLMIITLVAFSTMISAQTPEAVKEKFKTANPSAKNAYWKAENDKYKVNFVEGDQRRAIVYDKDGNVLKEKFEVRDANVPYKITAYYKDRGAQASSGNYEVWQVKDKDGEVYYYSEFKGKTSWFDQDGNPTTKYGVAEGELMKDEKMDQKMEPKDQPKK